MNSSAFILNIKNFVSLFGSIIQKSGALKIEGALLLGGSAQKGRLSFVQLSENEGGLLTGWGCYGILLP